MLKRPRVLIAEDYAGIVKAVSRLLSLDCDVVGSVTEGSAVVPEVQRLEPDVVILDIHLPNTNGLKVCRQIIDLNREVKVIVFTGTAEPDVRQRCFEAGASAFVSKMDADADLPALVKRLCISETEPAFATPANSKIV